VYTYHAVSRAVYLPEGKGWYNLYNGKYFTGGQTIPAEAPFSRIPVFVKAGSILPLGPAMEYTGEKPTDTLTLYVYSGADGHFDLYEDQGLNNDYEHGAYSIIPLIYRESSGQLTIGKRRGSFDAMLKSRVFRVRWITGVKPEGIDAGGAAADTSVVYSGDQIVIPLRAH
jgi:alpha-D-xyloside xylohydrolase